MKTIQVAMAKFVMMGAASLNLPRPVHSPALLGQRPGALGIEGLSQGAQSYTTARATVIGVGRNEQAGTGVSAKVLRLSMRGSSVTSQRRAQWPGRSQRKAAGPKSVQAKGRL